MSVVSRVAAAAASVQLMSLDPSRRTFEIYNDAKVAVLRIKVGVGPVTTTDFTTEVGSYQTYRREGHAMGPVYGIWDSAEANAGAQITEFF